MSNYPTDHQLYSDQYKAQLGKPKSEITHSQVREVVFLQPKCYSTLTCDDKTKQAAKGIDHCRQSKLKHDYYLKVHSNTECKFKNVVCVNIRKKDYKLYTVRNEKRALSKIDTKRYWKNNTFSLAFGHPDISVVDARENLQTRLKRKHKQINITILNTLDLTKKITRSARILFGVD